MTTIEKEIKSEVERVSQRLSQRIKELAERYERTLSDISNNVSEYRKKFMNILQKWDSKVVFDENICLIYGNILQSTWF
jgi:hypothetical protein